MMKNDVPGWSFENGILSFRSSSLELQERKSIAKVILGMTSIPLCIGIVLVGLWMKSNREINITQLSPETVSITVGNKVWSVLKENNHIFVYDPNNHNSAQSFKLDQIGEDTALPTPLRELKKKKPQFFAPNPQLTIR